MNARSSIGDTPNPHVQNVHEWRAFMFICEGGDYVGVSPNFCGEATKTPI